MLAMSPFKQGKLLTSIRDVFIPRHMSNVPSSDVLQQYF